MIKSSALSNLLKKSIENDIDMIFISRLTGEILCSEKKAQNENELIPDILSSTFSDYMGVDQNENKLNLLLIENEDSNLACTPLYDYFIAMKAKKEMPVGKLKLHLNILKKNLVNVLDKYKDKLISEKKEEE